MRMTVEKFGEAIRAAYEEGYTQGAYHPKAERIVVKRRELSGMFWAIVRSHLSLRTLNESPAPSTGGTP